MGLKPNMLKSRACWAACGFFAAATISLITLAVSQRLHYAYALGAGATLGMTCGFFWLKHRVKQLENNKFKIDLYELTPEDRSMEDAENQFGVTDDSEV